VQIPFFDRVDEPGFDVEAELESRVTDRSAALYINTPHNPTGAILRPATIRAMLRVAERHDLWVISDEAYEEIYFGDERPRPVWTYPEGRGRVVATHTLSKSYGLAGARIGFTHGPEEAMRAIRSAQTFSTYCAARPMQVAAAAALRHGEGWVKEARALYREAAELTARTLGVPRPPGGTFIFFDASDMLDAHDESALPFLERALDAGVLMTPGSACGDAYHRWVRLCFTSVPRSDLERALARLRPLLGPQSPG
jgi:N-succinyldiaminopimelate aminotransferase